MNITFPIKAKGLTPMQPDPRLFRKICNGAYARIKSQPETTFDLLTTINAKVDKLSRSSCDFSGNMVQFQQRAIPSLNLDSAICSGFSESQEGDDEMSSKYRERVKIGINPDGTPLYAWACGGTKDELHRAIAALLSPSNNISDAGDCTLWDEYARDWFDNVHAPKVRPKTAEKEGCLFRNHIVPAFAGLKLNEIDPKTVQAYLTTKSNYSTCYVRDLMNLMGQVFSCALDEGYIAKNPMDSTRVFNPSTKPENERQALTPEAQADIIAGMDTLTEPNARRLMALLMFTPLRPCEILGLQWQDVDTQTMTLNIKRDLVFVKGKGIIGPTKTEDSARPVPFDNRLKNYLEPFGTGDDYIICMTQHGREGKHLSSDSVLRNLWKRIGKLIDLHGMTPYIGRHTFATNMSRAGVPLATAKSYMGHKDERMLLRRYTHVDQTDLTNANQAISAYIGNLSSGL